MTKEEAIDVLKHNYPSSCYEDLCKAVDMAVKALGQPEPCEDTISRQMAIDAVSRGCQEFRGIFAECEKNLNELPSAQPEQKWIPVSERLPDMWDERYLVSLAWGGEGVMEYKSTGFHNCGSFTPTPIESIIAWMPLPEPYKEEQG